MGNKWVVTGIPEIDKALAELERKAQRKIVSSAMRKAMKIVQAEAKNNAPVDTGELKKSIKVRAGKRRRGAITIDVRTQDPNHKEKFLEFGTVKMAARPFMRPAYDTKGEQAKKQAIAEILEGIERAADQG